MSGWGDELVCSAAKWQRSMQIFFLFLSWFVRFSSYWRVGDFYCAVFCWLNWTANQSCFSPLSLSLHFATERGRCLDSSTKKKSMFCCRLESRNGAKNREECEQQGIQNPSAVVSSTDLCDFFHQQHQHLTGFASLLVSCVFDRIIVL